MKTRATNLCSVFVVAVLGLLSGVGTLLQAQNTTTFQVTSDSQVRTIIVNHQGPTPPGDSDHNGLPDAWELANFGRIGVNPNGDPDNDGFTNLQEFQNGTDPNFPNLDPTDTDLDGLPDAWEMRYFGTLDYGPDDQFNGMTGTLLQYFQQGLIPRLLVPDVISGLRAWYGAGIGLVYGDNHFPPPIRLWADISGNGLHVVQNTAAAQPIYSRDDDDTNHMIFSGNQRLVGVAADVLAGASDLTVLVVVNPQNAQSTDATVVALGDGATGGFVLRQNGANTNQFALSWQRAADQSVQGGSIAVGATANQLQVLTFVKNGTTQSGYLNGDLQASGAVAADLQPAIAQLSLGGQSGQGIAGFSGEINEILVYNRALSAVEQAQVEYALLHKYGLDDIDGNGLPDKWEKQNFGHRGVDPSADPDGDGDTNLVEYQNGSDPNNAASNHLDIDGNGLPDTWEMQYFGHTGVDPGADADGDGVSNLQEYLNGTNPRIRDVGPKMPGYALINLGQNIKVADNGTVMAFNNGTFSFWHNGSPVSFPTNITPVISSSYGAYLVQGINGQGDVLFGLGGEGNSPFVWHSVSNTMSSSMSGGATPSNPAGTVRPSGFSSMSNNYIIGEFLEDEFVSPATPPPGYPFPYYGGSAGYEAFDGARWSINGGPPHQLGNIHLVIDSYGASAGAFGTMHNPMQVNDEGDVVALVSEVNIGNALPQYQLNDTILDFLPTGLNNSKTVIGQKVIGGDLLSVGDAGWWQDGIWHDLDDQFRIAIAINNRGDILTADAGSDSTGSLFLHKGDSYERHSLDDYLPAHWAIDFTTSISWTPLASQNLPAWAPSINNDGLIGIYATHQPVDSNGHAQGPEEHQAILLVPAQLAVDANRDGTIKLASEDASDTTSATNPYHFWLNDDIDGSGDDTNGNDIPGSTTPDGQQVKVQGTRDLVDFFPVFLDLKQLLTVLPPSASVKYKLKNADDGLRFVYTDLARVDAFKYLKDSATGNSLKDADAHWVTAAGYELDATWVGQVKDADKGVILIEGRSATDKPLVLSVEKADGTVIAEVKLELKIVPVETMFRHLNLHDRNLTGLVGSMPGGTAQPEAMGDPAGFPDNPNSDSRWLIFMHGFNVSGQASRGWNAEMFKRCYWSGNKSRFVGVSWFGNPDQVFGAISDYHLAVRNAMITAPVLAQEINALSGGADTKTLFAHSLGCGVISSAIADYGMNIGKVCFVDAALARECFDGRDPNAITTENDGMRPAAWKTYDKALYAANWFKLFDPVADARGKLTWNNRFSGVSSVVYNFYSSTEDVLAETTEEIPPSVNNLPDFPFLHGSFGWVFQEKGKGNRQYYALGVTHLGSLYGGWGFNLTDPANLTVDPVYYWLDGAGGRHPLDPSQIQDPSTQAGKALFQRLPLFDPGFGNNSGVLHNYDPSVLRGPNWLPALFDNTTGSATAAVSTQRDQLLAEAIPSLTWCLGSHKSQSGIPSSRNINLPTLVDQSNWPRGKPDGTTPEWRHSDMREVAYLYLYGVFDQIVALSKP